MPVLQVFDPPMCCSTGVCGPSVDPELARFSGDLEWLKTQVVEVRRSTWPKIQAPSSSTRACSKRSRRGAMTAYRCCFVDERVAVEGAYPSRETPAALTGVVVRKLAVGASCCGPSASSAGTKKSGCLPSVD